MVREAAAGAGLMMLVLVCLHPNTRAGEPGDGELARDLTVQGIAAQQRGDHEVALAYFERAAREIDHPKIRYFRGKSLDAMGRTNEALIEFRAIEGAEANLKYAAETKAFIRAISAERQAASLMAKLAALERKCAASTALPVKVAPHAPEQK